MIWKREEAAEGGAPEGGKHMAEQSGGEVTIVGQGAKLEGKIVSAGSLRIDGQIKGTIDADGDVMLSPTSTVEADISAASVSVAGKFKGDIDVKGKAEIARGGRVDGNITSKSLVIQEGATFNGQSRMDGAAPVAGQAPAAGQAAVPAKAEGSR